MEETLNNILQEVRNLSYLFFAFGAIWIILFGYLLTLGRREQKLSEDLEALKRDMEEERHAPEPAAPRR